jgi:tetratricopeptide (TPR) repeat protein
VKSRTSLGVEDVVSEVPALATDDAVDLVVARAQQRGVVLSPDEKVRELVDRLDGVPLALELAAGRLGVLSVRDILDRLGLRLLRGSEDALSDALDWSWDLLGPLERRALAQLSTFAGSATLPVIEQVVDLDGFPVTDALSRLVDHSLIVTTPDSRLRLLLPVRDYAAARLGVDAAVALRHATAYARLSVRPGTFGLPDRPSLASLDDLDDLFAACRYAIAIGNGELALAALSGVTEVTRSTGVSLLRAADLAEATLRLVGPLHEDRARALRLAGGAHLEAGRLLVAQDQFVLALDAARASGDRGSEGFVLARLGTIARNLGRSNDGAELLRQALALHIEVGDPQMEAETLTNLGSCAYNGGRLDEAERHYVSAVGRHRENGDPHRLAVTLQNLASLQLDGRRIDEGIAHLIEARVIHRERGNLRFEGRALVSLGTAHVDAGRAEEADACFREALVLARRVDDRRNEASARENLALSARRSGDLAEAEAQLMEAIRIHRSFDERRGLDELLGMLAVVMAMNGRAAEADTLLREAEDASMGAMDAVLDAKLALCRAELSWWAGDRATAAAALARSEERIPSGYAAFASDVARVRTLLSGAGPPSS